MDLHIFIWADNEVWNIASLILPYSEKPTYLVQDSSNYQHWGKSIYSFLLDAWKNKFTDPENISLFIFAHIHNPPFLIEESHN